ncbi:VPS4-associated protein 1 [Scleroderma yunnanense]
MSMQNLYYKRTAATAKACFICYKPTTTVLATIDTIDFLYTCPIHLTDNGFATRVKDNEPDQKNANVSAEEIAKIRQEWEEKQKKKKEKEKEKNDKERGEGDKEQGKKAAEETPETEATATAPVQPTLSIATPKLTHERYVLHRDIFSLRVADHRRRRQTAQAKTLAPRLPGTPTNTIR